MTGSIPTSSLLLWCFMDCEEYNKRGGGGGVGLIRVATSRAEWQCEGSAGCHNNRLIEVII